MTPAGRQEAVAAGGEGHGRAEGLFCQPLPPSEMRSGLGEERLSGEDRCGSPTTPCASAPRVYATEVS
jgi:hypothetical protein